VTNHHRLRRWETAVKAGRWGAAAHVMLVIVYTHRARDPAVSEKE